MSMSTTKLGPPAVPRSHLPKVAVNLQNSDENLLASLGYRQELRRAYSTWELFGIGFSLIGLFPSIAYVAPMHLWYHVYHSSSYPIEQVRSRVRSPEWRASGLGLGCEPFFTLV